MKFLNKSSLLIVSTLALNACFNVKMAKPVSVNNAGGSADHGGVPLPSDPGSGTTPSLEEETVNTEDKGSGTAGDAPSGAVITTVGVKNSEQILRSMSQMTSIPTTTVALNNANRSIYTVFSEDFKGLMPSNNSIGSFNTNSQIAIVKLAFTFCDLVPNNVAIRTELFPNMNMASPANTLNDAQIEAQVVLPIMDRYWGVGALSDAAREKSIDTLVILASNISKRNIVISNPATNRAPTISDLVKSVCTAALSASPVVLF